MTPTELAEFKRLLALNVAHGQHSDFLDNELAEFRRLLALYLAFTCAHCQSKQVEDRHILTCTGCGVVLSDLRTMIGRDKEH